MSILKRFVHQISWLEGSIAESWLHKECIYYLLEYLLDVDEDGSYYVDT